MTSNRRSEPDSLAEVETIRRALERAGHEWGYRTRFVCWLLGHVPVESIWHDEGLPLSECARCKQVDVGELYDYYPG